MKRLAALAILLVTFLAGHFSNRIQLSTVQAQSPLPPRIWNVPKEWGQFKGVYHDQLLFEDDRGTLRSVFPNSSTLVFTIRRH
jgi:hypothetical protein